MCVRGSGPSWPPPLSTARGPQQVCAPRRATPTFVSSGQDASRMDDVEEDKPQARAPGEPTDVDLVRAYREGDVHAFEELHRRYVASIYRLVRRKLGDALLAEDIAQETFMKALRMMDRVDDSVQLGGRIHTAGRHLRHHEACTA